MRRVQVQEQSITVRISPPASSASLSLVTASATALSYIRAKIGAQAATAVFILFSLVFGSAIVFIVPPLRGPDEIAHFLRIYSYTRGELLPSAELNGRKGVMVERELYNKLQFFRTAGEWFATALRYGGDGSLSGNSSLATTTGRTSSTRTLRSGLEAILYVGASIPFPAGGVEGS